MNLNTSPLLAHACRRIVWQLFLLSLMSLAFGIPSQAAERQGYIPGRFIIKFNSELGAGQVRQSLAAGRLLEPLFPAPLRASASGGTEWGKYFVLSADSSATVEDVRSEIGAANVSYVEQDQYLEFYDQPTDPLFAHQWYLLNDGQDYFGITRNDGYYNDELVLKSGIAGSDIKLREFYDNPPADTHAVVVGVIDTGTDPLHPELAGRFWQNPGEIPGNGADDDHNGFVDDTLGWDISGDTSKFFDITGDPDVTDIHGHGTHIAGIIASNANGVGIVGVAPWAKLMSIKISPNAFVSIGTAGLIYAVNNGANSVNISWGTPFKALVLEDALRYARQNDVFVAIAAGNTGDSTEANPAAIDSAFAVGAGNSRGYLTWFSTWGPFVDLVAPGEDMLSLRASGTDMYASGGEPGVRIIGPDSLYYLSDGTSMAAPVAAGAAALLFSFRPDLSVTEVEDLLRSGADDMVDPLERGDTLIGPDSVCGYGYLNVARSIELLLHGSATLTSPLAMQRYSGAVAVRAVSIAGYAGGWTLAYSVDSMSENWQALASGSSLSSESTIYTFDQPQLNGWVNLRLTDDFGHHLIRRFTYVNSDSLDLISPQTGDTLRYSIPIRGDIFGVSYDSLKVSYRLSGGEQTLFTGTQEYFDTVVTNWNASGLKSGNYTLYLRGYFDGSALVDSARIYIASSFAAGWPQTQPSRGAQTVVVADLEHDGINEVIATSAYGLFVYEANGQIRPGFPVLIDKDMRCLPAIYDVDLDGVDDVITVNTEGLHVFKADGTYAQGWPRLIPTGVMTIFGAPTPSVVELIPGQTPVIMFVDGFGTVQAYRLNGDPYFFSLGGLFTTFPSHPTPTFFFAGNSVSTADLNGDGTMEVVVNYCGLDPWSGIAIYDGRTGRPAFHQTSALAVTGMLTYGMALCDLTGDSLPEIIVTGQDETFQRTLWVKTKAPDGNGMVDLAGFPKVFPHYGGWIGNYPTVGDLDLDGIPEIVCTFYEFDIGALVIYRANGQPYVSVDGSPEGEAFREGVTFSNPIVANLVGDEHPEIVIRGGYILPGTGNERVYLLDQTGLPVPGYPITTPANKRVVISDNFSPLIDDIDSDGLVELAMPSDASEIYIWDFEASSDNGRNVGRYLRDNRNSNIYPGASVITDVPDDQPELPNSWQLSQNYPNPFNPSTTIAFDLPRQSHVKLVLYNLLGQQVQVLADEALTAGRHTIECDGAELASGVYLYRLEGDGFVATRKMVLLK
jgi:subtilisin family serine protease